MSFATGVQNPTKAPSAGFADPVRDAQGCFRAIMNALARPGTLQRIDPGALEPPAPLTPTAAAVALTLFDYDTPIWLDPSLARSAAVAAFLRFHTGAPIVADALEAAFALVADPLHLPTFGHFSPGTAEYPDRSATLILMVEALGERADVRLSGPGIPGERTFSVRPLPPQFWQEAIENNARFPCGVDCLFVAPSAVAALPRSTRIAVREA